MSQCQALVLSLYLGVASAFTGFSNVTHLDDAIMVMGVSASADGAESFYPGTNGHSTGLYESFNYGEDISYLKGVGEVIL